MARFETIKILCVDDEPNILRTLQRFFRHDVCSVLTAASASEAMAILEGQGPIQLIISDFRMPGLNGVEFLTMVKMLWPETVGVLLSGYADLPLVTAAIDEDLIFRQLAKPWKRDELRQVVNEALQFYADNQSADGPGTATDSSSRPAGGVFPRSGSTS